MKHEFYESCGNPTCGQSCPACNVEVCMVCGLSEESLTTDCPGYDAREFSLYVEIGRIDFVDGKWIKRGTFSR